MTACACTINVTCHSTADGVSKNIDQDRAQAVAMATKHPDNRSFVKKSPFECTLVLILIAVTTSASTINVTYHSTADGVPEISVQDCAQAVAMATKHTKIYSFVEEITIWMHTRPDIDPCDGWCTRNQHYMSQQDFASQHDFLFTRVMAGGQKSRT